MFTKVSYKAFLNSKIHKLAQNVRNELGIVQTYPTP